MLASSKERITTKYVLRIGIPVVYTKDLNEFREAYTVGVHAV